MRITELPDNVQIVINKADLLAAILEAIALSKHKAPQTTDAVTDKAYFTQDEAALYLGIAKNTLYTLTSKREIAFHKRGGKANFFLKGDLDDWFLGNRKPSQNEIVANTDKFLGGKKKGGKDGK